MSSISEALGPLPQQFVVRVTSIQPAVAGAEKQLCAANPLRWGIIIAAPIQGSSGQAEPSWIAPQQGIVNTQTGIPISASQPPPDFNFRDHGILPQQAWYGAVIGTGAASNWLVIEILIQQ